MGSMDHVLGTVLSLWATRTGRGSVRSRTLRMGEKAVLGQQTRRSRVIPPTVPRTVLLVRGNLFIPLTFYT